MSPRIVAVCALSLSLAIGCGDDSNDGNSSRTNAPKANTSATSTVIPATTSTSPQTGSTASTASSGTATDSTASTSSNNSSTGVAGSTTPTNTAGTGTMATNTTSTTTGTNTGSACPSPCPEKPAECVPGFNPQNVAVRRYKPGVCNEMSGQCEYEEEPLKACKDELDGPRQECRGNLLFTIQQFPQCSAGVCMGQPREEFFDCGRSMSICEIDRCVGM